MKSAFVHIVIILFGVLLRLTLFQGGNLQSWVADSNEFVTPITSWKSVTEGLSLYRHKISPYSGDVFHLSPLSLRALSWFVKKMPRQIPALFALTDGATALILSSVAGQLVTIMIFKQRKESKQYAKDVAPLLVSQSSIYHIRLLVLVGYAFNPLMVGTCLARSVAVLQNFLLASSILFALKGWRVTSLALLAYMTYESLYPAAFLVPFALCFLQQRMLSPVRYGGRGAIVSYGVTATIFASFLGALLYVSHSLEGNWDFLRSTYGFILTVPDLSPNLGLFWYFFTEMFDHFRVFFLWVFQMNAFVYTIPLAIVLRHHPEFMIQLTLMMTAVFKSYPSYADLCFPLALLPAWAHLNRYVKNSLVVGCMLVCACVLAPILRHLWLVANSANANFYFAVGLVYSTAQVFLLTDFLFAFFRREFHLHNGMKILNEDGNKADITLK